MNELRERINDVIAKEPVALFMKGTPSFVMCGNSHRALQALRRLLEQDNRRGSRKNGHASGSRRLSKVLQAMAED